MQTRSLIPVALATALTLSPGAALAEAMLDESSKSDAAELEPLLDIRKPLCVITRANMVVIALSSSRTSVASTGL